MKYADAIYGNLAYDAPLERPQELPEQQAERQEEEHAAERVHVRQKVKAAPKQALSVFAIVGGVCIAALMFLIVLSHTTLNALSEQTGALNEEMKALDDEQARLQIAYESAIDLNEVESYAMSELGMVKAGEHQIHYITNAVEDKAVVLEVDDGGGILGALQRFFNRIAEYFR